MDFVVAAEEEGGGCVEEEEMLGAWISIIGMPMCGFVIARRRGFVESIIVVGGEGMCISQHGSEGGWVSLVEGRGRGTGFTRRRRAEELGD